jgi:hypothetical protein
MLRFTVDAVVAAAAAAPHPLQLKCLVQHTYILYMMYVCTCRMWRERMCTTTRHVLAYAHTHMYTHQPQCSCSNLFDSRCQWHCLQLNHLRDSTIVLAHP